MKKASATQEELVARQKVFVERRVKLKQAYTRLLVVKPAPEQITTYKRINNLARECANRINQLNQLLGISRPKHSKSKHQGGKLRIKTKKVDMVFEEGHLKLNGNYFVEERQIDDLYTVYKDHHRLTVFAHKGLKCVVPGCEQVGSRLIVCMDRQGGLHADIYTHDLHLMTVDHIHPKSKGGSEILDNKQPMCQAHNTKKSDKIIKY